MNNLEALILGIVQGITEFIPVSSSGHLTLLQHLFGFENLKGFLLFDLICHLGTLAAIFLLFFNEICQTLKNRTFLFQIALATFPLFPAALFIKQIEILFDSPKILSLYFLLTATLLWLGIRLAPKAEPPPPSRNPIRDSFFIGLSQVIALLPGVSRSGTTISTARILGWGYEEAIRFSFLMAIPAILGAFCLQLMRVFLSKEPLPLIDWHHYLIGFSTSFIFGCLSLYVLKQLGTKDKFSYFAWYCGALALLCLFLF